jgi:hypothetical protein
MKPQLKTPVAFIMFNRPKCTRRVFAEIRKARPEKLYLIADGPRPQKNGEAARCAETRQIVERMIDWPCEVHKDYAEQNMGCGQRVPSGLDWVFEQEETAIIMEDDILVDPSFFPFCETMLDRYRHDGRIMQIGGYNRFNYDPGNSSYFFSRYCDIWGWATWCRAWQKFRAIDSAAWEKVKKENLLVSRCASVKETKMRTFVLDDIYSGKLSAWGMRWELAKIMNQGRGIVPSRNLVKNIGFGLAASHTVNPFNRNQFMRVHTLNQPYLAPSIESHNHEYDALYLKAAFPDLRFEKFRTLLLKLLLNK